MPEAMSASIRAAGSLESTNDDPYLVIYADRRRSRDEIAIIRQDTNRSRAASVLSEFKRARNPARSLVGRAMSRLLEFQVDTRNAYKERLFNASAGARPTFRYSADGDARGRGTRASEYKSCIRQRASVCDAFGVTTSAGTNGTLRVMHFPRVATGIIVFICSRERGNGRPIGHFCESVVAGGGRGGS